MYAFFLKGVNLFKNYFRKKCIQAIFKKSANLHYKDYKKYYSFVLFFSKIRGLGFDWINVYYCCHKKRHICNVIIFTIEFCSIPQEAKLLSMDDDASLPSLPLCLLFLTVKQNTSWKSTALFPECYNIFIYNFPTISDVSICVHIDR